MIIFLLSGPFGWMENHGTTHWRCLITFSVGKKAQHGVFWAFINRHSWAFCFYGSSFWPLNSLHSLENLDRVLSSLITWTNGAEKCFPLNRIFLLEIRFLATIIRIFWLVSRNLDQIYKMYDIKLMTPHDMRTWMKIALINSQKLKLSTIWARNCLSFEWRVTHKMSKHQASEWRCTIWELAETKLK